MFPVMSVTQPDYARRFAGIGRLYGQQALARFAQAHVCVVGIGGVGSWAAEALARSAIGQLTLIDLDHVAESNINRTVHGRSRPDRNCMPSPTHWARPRCR